ncbi:SAV_2336 N-terminal domain-related protein [Streptomyces lasalocidi]
MAGPAHAARHPRHRTRGHHRLRGHRPRSRPALTPDPGPARGTAAARARAFPAGSRTRPRPPAPALPRAATAADRRHTTLLAPAPPMLRHPLALQRALRPLGRRVDAPVGHELAERETADRIARLGADPEWWLPVLRPARERWLRLNLVYDAGPTMPVWRPLIRELHTVLAQSGLFRTVALYRAAADGTVRGPGPHAPADGRSITLLISDCMGPQWREGPAGTLWYATLHRWARRMPLAVVQPLPEHLWRDTALPTTPGRLSAPYPAAPTATLAFTSYERPESAGTEGIDGMHGSDLVVPLPVLEPEPRWLGHWAGLLTAPGGVEFPAAVAELGCPLPADAEDRTDVGLLSAEELVLRFRATASPEAFRLAEPSRGGATRSAGHAAGAGRRRTGSAAPAPGGGRPQRHAHHGAGRRARQLRLPGRGPRASPARPAAHRPQADRRTPRPDGRVHRPQGGPGTGRVRGVGPVRARGGDGRGGRSVRHGQRGQRAPSSPRTAPRRAFPPEPGAETETAPEPPSTAPGSSSPPTPSPAAPKPASPSKPPCTTSSRAARSPRASTRWRSAPTATWCASSPASSCCPSWSPCCANSRTPWPGWPIRHGCG